MLMELRAVRGGVVRRGRLAEDLLPLAGYCVRTTSQGFVSWRIMAASRPEDSGETLCVDPLPLRWGIARAVQRLLKSSSPLYQRGSRCRPFLAGQPYSLSRRQLTRSRKERELGEGSSYVAEEEEYVQAKRACHSKERLTVVLDMDEVRDAGGVGCVGTNCRSNLLSDFFPR